MLVCRAVGGAQGFDRLGTRRKPDRHHAEKKSGDHRESESKAQHWPGWSCIDGNVAMREGEMQNEARAVHRDGESGRAPAERQKQRFGECLPNETGPRGADGGADGDLLTARRGTREQQVGEIGASDEQHKPRNPEQQFQTNGIVLAHALHSGTAGERGESPVVGSVCDPPRSKSLLAAVTIGAVQWSVVLRLA